MSSYELSRISYETILNRESCPKNLLISLNNISLDTEVYGKIHELIIKGSTVSWLFSPTI